MEHISIKAETLFHIGPLPVTSTILTAWVVMLVLIVIALLASRNIQKIPGKLQNLVEFVIEALVDFFTTIAGSREVAIRFFPIAATLFLFVLMSNWMGILPGIGSIGMYELHEGEKTFVPLFRSVYSDVNMTLALALIVVVLSHVYGLITVGAKHHLGKFITFKGPIAFFTGILEIIGEISKIISLSFRLFGNIFAGEVLLIIVGSLVPYVATVPFLGLELFVGLIQAAIFAVLAMVAFSSFTRAEH
ncbi:MAG TPA: F0F1 ATP synthase subunit A [Candidatus Paceibacterota bacterium]